ncbi:MAG: hypothetical protein AAHH96_07375 [Candidatus Symbiodolus clandestinus]
MWSLAKGSLLGGKAQPVYVTNLGNVAGKLLPTKLGRALGKASSYLGSTLAIGSAAYQIYDTAKNANSTTEKVAGYGDAIGGLAGGLAGAKLGALAGSWGGPIGVAIGGVLGSLAGSLGGGKIGSWLGRSLFNSEPSTSGSPPAVLATANQPNNRELTQTLQFSPTVQVNVQGELKQPRQLAEVLMPHLHSLFEQFRQQQQRAVWYDAPQV